MKIYQCSNCYYEIDFQTYLERGGLCPICNRIIYSTNCYETDPSVLKLKLKERDTNAKTSES